jgi:hypothetical protein
MRTNYEDILPADWKPIGTLARNIFPRHIAITYGSVIVETPSRALTLDQIEQKLRSRYYAADDLLQAYADMVILDIFIGNMDRHHENWGVCEHNKYNQQRMFDRKEMIALRYFTPLFDHGSSLMFELSDSDVEVFLSNPDRLEKYLAASKFGFLLDTAGKPNNPFTIVSEHLQQKTSWALRFKRTLAKLHKIDMLLVAELVIQMPTLSVLEYGDSRRQLLYKSLLLRYNKLNELYRMD